MSADWTTVARTTLEGSETDSMSFPEGVKLLIEAGFDGYVVDFRRSVRTYYRPTARRWSLRPNRRSLSRNASTPMPSRRRSARRRLARPATAIRASAPRSPRRAAPAISSPSPAAASSITAAPPRRTRSCFRVPSPDRRAAAASRRAAFQSRSAAPSGQIPPLRLAAAGPIRTAAVGMGTGTVWPSSSGISVPSRRSDCRFRSWRRRWAWRSTSRSPPVPRERRRRSASR